MGLIQVVVAALCGVLVLVAAVGLVRDRTQGRAVLVLSGLIEVALIVHLVVGIVRLAGPHEVSTVTYAGYLVGVLLVMPAAIWWASFERTRAGTAVVLVGALTVAFLVFRTYDLWRFAGVTGG